MAVKVIAFSCLFFEKVFEKLHWKKLYDVHLVNE